MNRKFYIITTIAPTLSFFKGQPRLWKQNFDVTAISSMEERLKGFAEEEGINYKYLPLKREISFFSDIACLFRLIWLLVKEHPFIVHGNTPKASLLSMVAAWLTRRPVRIYMCHGLRYQTTSGILRRILMSMEWISCHCATIVLCVSKGVSNQLISDKLCTKKKAVVVGHGTAGGIDTNKFSLEANKKHTVLSERLGIPNDAFVFCFVGRVVRDKGINELVSAFDRLSNDYSKVYLILVGPIEKEQDPIDVSSERIIQKNKHIYSVGKQTDVRPYLAVSNGFVLPSYREGVGMVLLEANAMGVPCIASDIIGCNDVVTPGVNGELIEARNEDALYDKMKDWVENPLKVKIMSEKCRQYVISNYEAKDVRNAYFEEYKSLLF